MFILEVTATGRIYHVMQTTHKTYYVAKCGREIGRGKKPPALQVEGYKRCPECRALMFPCRNQVDEPKKESLG